VQPSLEKVFVGLDGSNADGGNVVEIEKAILFKDGFVVYAI
jgi:hypothetical protein